MSTYEIISLILSILSIIISGISLFLISNVYYKIKGNNNQSIVINDGQDNKIKQNR